MLSFGNLVAGFCGTFECTDCAAIFFFCIFCIAPLCSTGYCIVLYIIVNMVSKNVGVVEIKVKLKYESPSNKTQTPLVRSHAPVRHFNQSQRDLMHLQDGDVHPEPL